MSISALFAALPEPLAASLINYPNIVAFDFGRYLIAAPIMFAIVWLLKKTVWAYRQIQPRVASSADYRREFFASLRTCLIFSLSGIGVGYGINIGIFQEVELSMGLWTDLGLFAAIILAHDAYFYWSHRMMHHPRLFKYFHRLHHRSVTPTPFAAYAFNVPEALLMTAFMPLWLFLVATPVTVISAFLALMIVRNVMGHAGLELHSRNWLRNPLTSWINTTTHHDLHHCGGFNSNFGFYFRFWDWLMKTEHPDYVERYEEIVGRVPARKPALARSPLL